MEDDPFLERQSILAASSHACASPSEWDRARPLIKRLYVDEDNTLKQVMVIMARDHGHRGTMKMYKNRIKKWGLDKNTKEAEARALLRMKMQRDAVGKDSAFRVRGKPVTIEDLLRYFKRKGILNPGVEAQPPEVSMPPAIECWTPLSSPKPRFATIQAPEEEDVQRGADLLEFRGTEMSVAACTTAPDSTQRNDVTHVHLSIDQIRQVLFSSPKIQSFEIPYSPLPPQSLVVSEKLFASIKAYYGSMFDSGLFKTDDEGYLISVNMKTERNQLVEFYDLCCTGTILMDSKSFIKGRRCFSKASGLVSNILRGQEPRTLYLFLNTYLFLRKYGYNEIVLILQDLVHSIAIRLFTEEHPWRQLFSQIGTLDDSQFELAIVEVWRCIHDMFAHSLGQFHRTTLMCYTDFLHCKSSPNDSHQLHRSILIQGEQEIGKFDTRLLHVKYMYGKALYHQDRNAEAIAILEEIVVRCQEIDGQVPLEIQSLEMISLCQYGMGHKYEAKLRHQEAIERSEEFYGKSDPHTLRLKTCLEEWLREWGREDEAALLRAEIDEIMGPDDIQSEDIEFGGF